MPFKNSHYLPISKGAAICVVGVFGLITFLTAQTEETPTDETVQHDASENALISEREDVEIVSDSNVAEAVSRRPDLQFDNVTIDGEKSSISLDDIPADAVNELEVLRANTPDLDADARGGSLNLSSNPAFNLESPIFKADLEYTYSEKEDSWEQESSLTYGRSLGKLGFRITASQENEHDVSENYYMEWEQITQDGDTYYAPSFARFNHPNSHSISYSTNASVDYKISEQFHMFFRINYSQNDEEAHQPSILYKFYKGEPTNLTSNSGTRIGAQVDRDLTVWESEWSQFDWQIGGVYQSENFDLDYRFFQQNEHYVEPDWTVIQFKKTDVDIDYHIDENGVPRVFQSSQPILTDPNEFAFDEYLSELWENENDKWVATLNAKYDFEIGEANAYVKAGLKYTSRQKNQSSDSRIYTQENSLFTLSPLAEETGYDNLLVDGMSYGAFPTAASSRHFLANDIDSSWLNPRRSAEKGHPATYVANEDIQAAYMMLNVNYRRLRSIVGFRSERTELDYKANQVEIDSEGNYVGTNPTTGTNSYNNLFPSIHLRYFIGNKITLISSYTSTIKRPYYGNIVPYRYINYDAEFVEEGNPNLKPTTYDNFDLSLDYKLSDSSLLSLELFSKEVEDIVFWEVSDITSGVFAGFERGTNANGPSATEKGLRFILTQDLSEWNSLLDGFSLIFKVTLQDSETQYPERPEEKLPVTYRPDNIYEATLTYDKGPLFAQFSYYRNSTELQSVYSEVWQDVYQDGRDDLDISTSYKINDRFRLFLDIHNVLLAESKNYYGDPSRPSNAHWRSRKYNFGLKFSL